MRRILALVFSWADPGLVKIVSSNISPDVKAGSFASKPRTVYRQGAYLARVEEVDDFMRSRKVQPKRGVYLYRICSDKF